MAKKVTKPAAKQEQGGLEQALGRSEQFFENNKKTIFTVLAIIIILVAGGMLYSSKVVAPRELKASEALFPGERYFMEGDFQTALNGDAYGYDGFEAIADQYGNTKAGKLANAYAGLCCEQLDSFEVAAKYLAKFKGNDQMASPSILAALANCYANMEQFDKAASTFESAAKKADNNLLSPYFYFQAGLIYESLEKPAQALKLYQTIKTSYPESTEGQQIDKYITRLTNK